jgi:hypothetical protein
MEKENVAFHKRTLLTSSFMGEGNIRGVLNKQETEVSSFKRTLRIRYPMNEDEQ